MPITVTGLRVYPIKSLRGIDVKEWTVEKRGLRHDRRWMLVDHTGLFLTQRKLSTMALFDVAIEGASFRIGFRDKPDLVIPMKPQGSAARVQVWRSHVTALRQSEEADAWFSEALGIPCSLVHLPESSRRTAKGVSVKPNDIVGFADSNPILVAGEESLEDLNSRLTAPIPTIRFRPNIIVKGGKPFEEDEWPILEAGGARLRQTHHCGRCIVTTIDPETAKSSDEPLRTLATYRKRGRNVYFGSFFAPDRLGHISVGDGVQVLTG